MNYYVVLIIGMVSGVTLTALTAAIAMSKIVQKAIDALARQPENKTWYMILMILGLAFIESLVIYNLVISLTLAKDPFKNEVKSIDSIESSRPVIVESGQQNNGN